MKNYLLNGLLTMLVCACQYVPQAHINYYTTEQNVLVDTTFVQDTIPNEIVYNERGQRMGYYPVYYIGNNKDTIQLPRKAVSMFREYTPDSLYLYRVGLLSNISIRVDTTINFSKDTSYITYPIIIRNFSDTLCNVGSHNGVSLVKEIYTPKGKWQAVEKPIQWFCGANARELNISKKEVLIAKIIVAKKGKKVLCRLKYRSFIYYQLGEKYLSKESAVYSNSFASYE